MWRTVSDNGSGSILTVAILGAITALTVMLLPLYMGLATRQSVAGAADAAALAGADTAVGIVPGMPCEVAERAAAANGASIVSCDVDGLIVTVVAARMMLGVSVTAAATAGPGDSPVD